MRLEQTLHMGLQRQVRADGAFVWVAVEYYSGGIHPGNGLVVARMHVEKLF